MPTETSAGIVSGVCRIAWLLAVLVIAFNVFDYMISDPDSAPQQAALAGMRSFWVLVAYTSARSVEAIVRGHS